MSPLVAAALRSFVLPLSVCSIGFAALRQESVPDPGVVTASQFRLVRQDGSVAGVWAADEKGSVLQFADRAGRPRLRLLASEDGFVGMALLAADGKLRSLWCSQGDGGSALEIYGDEVPRIRLHATAKAGASVDVHDAQGVRRTFAGVLDNGASAFTLLGPEHKVLATLGTPTSGRGLNSSLVLYDPERGSMRAAVSVGDTGDPMVSLHGPREEMRSSWSLAQGGGGLAWFDEQFRSQAVFGSSSDGSAGLMVFDRAGQVLLRAPDGFDQGRPAERGRRR